GFAPGLTGTIAAANHVEYGNVSSTILVKGPGAKILTISGPVGSVENLAISGLTLTGGTYAAQGFTDCVIRGTVAVGADRPLSILRSTLDGGGGVITGVLANSVSSVATIVNSTITGYTDAG